MTHGGVFCFRWKARALNKLYKKFSVAVIFQNENELINYIPFGLDINALHTPEKTKLYLPSHKAFRRYFSLIFSMTAYRKLKANSSVIKLFKEAVHLPKLFEMHLLTFLIFPISQKKSKEFLHDPLCFMTLSYVLSLYLLELVLFEIPRTSAQNIFFIL